MPIFRKALLAHFALLTVAIIYGLNYVWAKDVMPKYIQPSGFILARVGGAGLLFVVFHWLTGWHWPRKEDWPRFVACGFMGVAGNQLLFFHGLSLTSPTNSAIIMTLSPLMVLFLAAQFGNERFGLNRWLGLAIAGSGAIWLVWNSQQGGNRSANALGDLFILLNGSMYAGYLVSVKPLMERYPPIAVIQWVFLIGLILVIPFGLNQFLMVNWISLPTEAIGKIGFVVLFTTFVAYLFNIFAIKVVGSSITGLYIYLQPVLAAFFVFLGGGGHPNLIQIISGLVVMLGVFMGSRK